MIERFETFTILINRITRNIRRIKNQEMAQYGLTGAHVSCLYYLYLSPGLTSAALCERCDEDKAAVSRALDYLEQNGFLRREDARKRYKSSLLLTPQGQEMGRIVAGKIDHVLEEISGTLTEQERLDFYRSLSRISSRLEQVATAGEHNLPDERN